MNSFQKAFEERSKIRKELTPPWWRPFEHRCGVFSSPWCFFKTTKHLEFFLSSIYKKLPAVEKAGSWYKKGCTDDVMKLRERRI